jgi:hypothetical protein
MSSLTITIKIWMLVLILAASALFLLMCRACYEGQMVTYFERMSRGMTADDVLEIIPQRFFTAEETATENRYLADRVFDDSGCVSRILVYAQTKGNRFADGRIYVDNRNVVIGLAYSADGFPPLSQTISNGVGPQQSRKYLSACK